MFVRGRPIQILESDNSCGVRLNGMLEVGGILGRAAFLIHGVQFGPMPIEPFTLAEERRLFFEGLAKFNEGDHFEAHDIWEEVWHQVPHRRREQFYRALIKGAVALVLLRQGRAVGARQVFVDCVNGFEGLPNIYMGLDIPQHIENLRHALAPAIQDLEARSVVVDPSRFFEISLLYNPFDDSRNREAADGR